MNQAEKARLAQIFALYAAYYRVKLEDAVIQMYVEDLCDLSFIEVEEALRVYRKNAKNRVMPLPAMLRDMVEPQLDDDTLARDAASRIVAAVSKFGWCNGGEARGYVGELAWSVVNRNGGWSYICENLGRGLDVGTFQAQARELAKTQIQLSRAGSLDLPPALPGPVVTRIDKKPNTKREFLVERARQLSNEIRLSGDNESKAQLEEILAAVKTLDKSGVEVGSE